MVREEDYFSEDRNENVVGAQESSKSDREARNEPNKSDLLGR